MTDNLYIILSNVYFQPLIGHFVGYTTNTKIMMSQKIYLIKII